MDIKHLEYFIEATRTGSITQAAHNLYITQPALSRIIKSLEEELGSALFIRSRKKLMLTEAGDILYKYAQGIVEQMKLIESEINGLHTLQKGNIRIGLPTFINSFFFSSLMSSFHKAYADITFQLEEDGSKRIEEKVLDGSLDLGIVVRPTKHESLEYYTFVNESLKLVVPPGHSFVEHEVVRLKQLKDEQFIMFNQDFALRDLVFKGCKEVGFEPKIISETSQIDFIEEMVASNLGITLLPESTCGLMRDVIILDVIEPKIDWNLAIIWKKEAQLSRVASEFIQFTKEQLQIMNKSE